MTRMQVGFLLLGLGVILGLVSFALLRRDYTDEGLVTLAGATVVGGTGAYLMNGVES